MRESLVMPERKSGGIRETLKTLVYAVAIALLVRTFLFEPFNIPLGSMKPTLLVGDYLFVSKFAYGYSRYSVPLGLLEEQLPEGRKHVVLDLTPNGSLDNTGVFLVPPGHILAMGDNRDNS